MPAKKIKIELNYLRPNASFIYPLYSENGDKIVDARVVLTTDLLASVIQQYGPTVYYTAEGAASIPDYRIKIALNTARDILDEITRTEKLSKNSYRTAEKLVEEILQDLDYSQIESISLLKTLKSFDDYLYNHSVNVGIMSALFAKKLGQFSKEEWKSLTLGAYLHDIGERMIDKQLLNKEGSLEISEIQKMKRHPQLGYEMIKRIDTTNTVTHQSILFHHEKYNNRGYFQLPYENLSVYSKIISVCDIFDALTSSRPYRKEAMTPEFALKSIVNSINIHFDYDLIRSFINLLSPVVNNSQYFYNINDICELNTKELALIKGYGTADLLKPDILVFCKFERDNLKTKVKFYDQPIPFDLANANGRMITKILNHPQQIESINVKLRERNII